MGPIQTLTLMWPISQGSAAKRLKYDTFFRHHCIADLLLDVPVNDV